MKTNLFKFLAFVCLLITSSKVGAETGVTNIINGVTTNAGTYYVGNTGPFNALIITNAGVLRVIGGNVIISPPISTDPTGNGIIGNSATANSNYAWVANAGSMWRNDSNLYVGSSGSFNQLTIASGGRVFSTNGYIGDSGNNNSVLVTGAASMWSNRFIILPEMVNEINPTGWLIVGNSGSGNSMTIANSGQVFSTYGRISGGGGSNNAVAVTGLGSVWNNGGGLAIGDNGSGNSLTITNGGQVFSAYGRIGGGGGSNNAVTVIGPGSVWNNGGGLAIGDNGSGNNMTIANGGQVIAGRGVYIRTSNWLYASNAAYIASVGLQIDNGGRVSLQSNTIWNLGLGTLSLGSDVASDLRIDASSTITNISGLALRGNNTIFYMTNSAAGVVFNEFTTNQLQFHGGLINLGLENNGSGATLVISNYVLNSGSLTTGPFVLPFGPSPGASSIGGTSDSNSVFMIGSAAVWSNAGDLFVGNAYRYGNGLLVTNGAKVFNASANIRGSGGPGSGSRNWALVTGTDSLWSNSGSLEIGGISNSLTIANGGSVIADGGVTVAGGNLWFDTGNWLYASNAGTIASVGLTLVGQGNTVTLVSNTIWNLRGGALTWGGISNSFIIDGSSAITNIYGLSLVGDTTFYMTNSAGGFVVNDLRTNQLHFASGFGGLTVGGRSSGSGTALIMSNYVLNTAGSSTVGNGSAIGSVLVTDGTVWSNSGSLFVNSGSTFGPPAGSSLTITNGGQVFDTDGGIGMGLVTGGIFVGTNFTPIISGANNNAALVSGPGSLWKNSGDLYVGATGNYNQLTISDGGHVLNVNGYIGHDSNANNNAVSVSGAASVWSNSGSLFVGYQGSGNSLTIANNSTVTASNVVIGATAISAGNLVTVSSGNLLVTNDSGGGLLDIRGGTLDLNGGLVYAGAVAVSNGSFLIGSGTIIGSVTNAGTMGPGNSPGTLNVQGDLTLLSSAVLDMELRGTATTEFDRLLVSGAFTADGILDVMLIDGFLPQPGDQFDLFNYASVGGSFNLINLPFGAGSWNTSHLLANPSDPLSGTIIYIPEPSTWTLLGLGLAALAMRRRSRVTP